jgi:phosphatidylserine/phosphatidylglycerophosphate/cardiolipin synthase-like enzyme
MHSKAILIDNKYLFIWSINFSKYSLDKNREIWILLKNWDIISKFKSLFAIDFEK